MLKTKLNEIKEILIEKTTPELKNNFTMISGWPASGSTFIFQVTQLLGIKAKKIHGSRKHRSNVLTFYTFRDPRDVLCSMAKRQYKEDWDKKKDVAILKALEDFKREKYKYSIKKSCNKNNTILIRYENFFPNNQKFIIQLIADQFITPIGEQKMNKILRETSIEKNYARSKELKNFYEVNKKTHIHGNHISNKGKIGGWKDSFSEEVKNKVKEELGDRSLTFKYELPGKILKV